MADVTDELQRVMAEIGSFNDASRQLVERLGFSREGRIRDHVFVHGKYQDVVQYGLLRAEWTDSPHSGRDGFVSTDDDE